MEPLNASIQKSEARIEALEQEIEKIRKETTALVATKSFFEDRISSNDEFVTMFVYIERRLDDMNIEYCMSSCNYYKSSKVLFQNVIDWKTPTAEWDDAFPLTNMELIAEKRCKSNSTRLYRITK